MLLFLWPPNEPHFHVLARVLGVLWYGVIRIYSGGYSPF